MNAPPKQSKFKAYRARKKAAGMREVRMWIPDLRNPAVLADLHRQATLIGRSDDERDAQAMMEELASEVWDQQP